ncbi:MAG: DUF4252 domain-containing protein [Bacteroidales bacterium]|nr:DUF4252 domain-containing protein [Bacteroidales bacterium]
MKKHGFIWMLGLSFLFHSTLVLAQESAVEHLFSKYSQRDGFTSVEMAGSLFQLFADVETDDEEFKEFSETVRDIKNLRIIIGNREDLEPVQMDEFSTDLMASLPPADFVDLITVKESDGDIRFMGRKQGNQLSELLMMVNRQDEKVLLSLTGVIDPARIARLGASMNLQGMEYLQKMDNTKSKEP